MLDLVQHAASGRHFRSEAGDAVLSQARSMFFNIVIETGPTKAEAILGSVVV